ncbi:MAG: hypothetical protein OXI13_13595 [Gammaproteobacteria bacterium]|nr:hypothetical protein [Gammaproteobacteria bacterium]
MGEGKWLRTASADISYHSVRSEAKSQNLPLKSPVFRRAEFALNSLLRIRFGLGLNIGIIVMDDNGFTGLICLFLGFFIAYILFAGVRGDVRQHERSLERIVYSLASEPAEIEWLLAKDLDDETTVVDRIVDFFTPGDEIDTEQEELSDSEQDALNAEAEQLLRALEEEL